MPKLKRSILLALILTTASGALAGCGGDSGPDPSLSADEAALLDSRLQEIQDNIDVGSCVVATDRTDELLADIDQLPSSVNDEVRRALENGANQLKLLIADPDQCESQTTTTEPTTTEEEPTTTEEEPTTTEEEPTTTEETTPTQPTTPTQTQPTTPTTGGSGGIGPGGL